MPRAMLNLSPRKISWAELIGGGLILAFLIYDQGTKRDLFAGWNALLLLAAAIIAGLLAYCAYRKWREG